MIDTVKKNKTKRPVRQTGIHPERVIEIHMPVLTQVDDNGKSQSIIYFRTGFLNICKLEQEFPCRYGIYILGYRWRIWPNRN